MGTRAGGSFTDSMFSMLVRNTNSSPLSIPVVFVVATPQIACILICDHSSHQGLNLLI